MKSSPVLLLVAAVASSTFATPTPAPGPSSVVTMVTGEWAKPAWTGDNTVRCAASASASSSAFPFSAIRLAPADLIPSQQLSRRSGKKGTAEACESGKDECQEGLGCYGCWNHTTVCQRGPGSNECCFRDELGPICQVIPLGKND